MKCRFIRKFSMLWETKHANKGYKIPLGYFTVAFSVEHQSCVPKTPVLSHSALRSIRLPLFSGISSESPYPMTV